MPSRGVSHNLQQAGPIGGAGPRRADKCVLDSCRYMQQRGWDVTYLPVRSDGLVDMATLEAAMRPDTAIVSVMLVNNEIGACLPALRGPTHRRLGLCLCIGPG